MLPVTGRTPPRSSGRASDHDSIFGVTRASITHALLPAPHSFCARVAIDEVDVLLPRRDLVMLAEQLLYDLGEPTTVEAVRDFHAPYVQWDLIFETRFKADPLDPVEPAGLSPSTPLPMINYLVIPYRF